MIVSAYGWATIDWGWYGDNDDGANNNEETANMAVKMTENFVIVIFHLTCK